MLSEQVCLDIIAVLHRSTVKSASTRYLDESGKPPVSEHTAARHAAGEAQVVRSLVAKYDLDDIDAAIRWLLLGFFIRSVESHFGATYQLTGNGLAVATAGRFPDEERMFFRLVEPHQVFLAHQFSEADTGLERAIRSQLHQAGYSIVDGKVDGLEPFRHAILQKIKRSRFFLCLLTRRSELKAGGFASSVWLYQEIGAAVALGKAPLLLVESEMDLHYAGELQKNYEYVPFDRSTLERSLPDVVRRLGVDLERAGIPLPDSNSAGPV